MILAQALSSAYKGSGHCLPNLTPAHPSQHLGEGQGRLNRGWAQPEIGKGDSLRNMHEDVLGAILRRDEAVAL